MVLKKEQLHKKVFTPKTRRAVGRELTNAKPTVYVYSHFTDAEFLDRYWGVVQPIWGSFFKGKISVGERDKALAPLRQRLAYIHESRRAGGGGVSLAETATKERELAAARELEKAIEAGRKALESFRNGPAFEPDLDPDS